MEDRAHQQIVRREIPVISTALPVRVDQHVRDELRIPHVIRPLANLEQRVVAGRGAIGRRRVELETYAAEAVPPPAGGQGPVLAFDVVDNHARWPAQQRREHQAHTLARPGRSEGEDVLRSVMAQVNRLALVGPGADVDAAATHEPGGLEIRAGSPARGAMRVRRPREPPGSPDGYDDGDENGGVAWNRHHPGALAPDCLGAQDVAEPPPPDEEVEGR